MSLVWERGGNTKKGETSTEEGGGERVDRKGPSIHARQSVKGGREGRGGFIMG